MKTIDCSGMLCPKPLIETKRALNEGKAGEKLKVIVDNDTSLTNLTKYLSDNGIVAEYIKEDGKHTLTFLIIQITGNSPDPQEYCETSSAKSKFGDYIIVFDKNSMGGGNDELGELLVKGFLSTICELELLPKEIICYNSGVKLIVKNTPTAVNLLKLNNLGVKITLCGTCVDFYGIKNEIAAGDISNMYYIAGKLTSGIRVVTI